MRRKTSVRRSLTLLLAIFLTLSHIRKCQFITSNGIEPTITTYGSTHETFTISSLWVQGVKLQTRKLNNKHLLYLLLVLSADIETRPGPSTCQTCLKTVRCNQKRLRCSCACTKMNHQTLPSREETSWVCPT